jgi:hypothetical protein
MRGPRSTGSGRSSRVAAAALVAFVAVGVAGCGLLFPGPMGGFNPEAEPSPIATFTEGHATLAFGDGTKVDLGTLNHGPHIYTQMGSNVRWSNGDGWSIGVMGAGGDFGFGSGGDITIDHIADHKHLTALAEGRCIVTTKTADKTGISGTATCKGLHWIDIGDGGMFGPFGESPDPSAGPGFDVDITFEATP